MVVEYRLFTQTLEKTHQTNKITLKDILEIVDLLPILNEDLLALGEQVATDTLSSVIICYQSMLPKMLKPNSTFKKAHFETMTHFDHEPLKYSPKQKSVLDVLKKDDKSLD